MGRKIPSFLDESEIEVKDSVFYVLIVNISKLLWSQCLFTAAEILFT